jgi:long-chain fatty acid transport protein
MKKGVSMKRIILVLSMLMFIVTLSFAGGIVTNTNHSAAYTRMLSRIASTDIDAVYYNPAGLAKLGYDGFYFSFNNQTIVQDETINNDYPLLNSNEYNGDVSAPLFPGIYAAYKQGSFVYSIGMNPLGGGGSAEYAKGLPSFEIDISGLPTMLTQQGIPTNNYDVDLYFEGSSVYWGFQTGITYEMNPMFSTYLGGRFIYAQNDYDGYIKDVMIDPQHPQINPEGEMMLAYDFFMAAGMEAQAAQVADKEVDAKQTGSGFSPIFGFNFSPNEQLNIGLKYEFKTPLELENDTTKDDVGMFPDGEKTSADIPALLAMGVSYKALPMLTLSTSLHYYFDKDVDWDGREELIDTNSYELGFGLEYVVNEMITLSSGYLHTAMGVEEQYNSDMDFILSSNSGALGGKFMLSPTVDFNIGFIYTKYTDTDKTLYDEEGNIYAEEEYQKESLAFGFGFDWKLFR